MPIAKQTLTIGWAIAANPGNYVTKEAVQRYGWADLVDDGDDVSASDGNTDPGASPAEAPNDAAEPTKNRKPGKSE